LNNDFPEVTFIGVAELVGENERPVREARWRQEYGPGFRFHPDLPATARHPGLGELTNVLLPLIYVRPQGLPFESLCAQHGLDLTAIPDGGSRRAAQAHKAAGIVSQVPLALLPEMVQLPESQESRMHVLPISVKLRWHDPLAPGEARNGALICGVDFHHVCGDLFGQLPPGFNLDFTLTLADGRVPTPVYGAAPWGAGPAPAGVTWLYKEKTCMLYQSRLHGRFWTTADFDRDNYRQGPWLVALVGGLFTLLAAGLAGLQTHGRLAQQRAAEQLRRSNEQVAASTRERSRLSRDLHDGTIQNLYALGLELGHARSLLRRDAGETDQELGRALTSLQATITELRQFVLELEPDAWAGQSVSGYLTDLIARMRRTTPLQIHMHLDPDCDRLPGRTSIHLLQLVREAMSNVRRHARAENVWLTLQCRERTCRLTVRDDGCGFDPAAATGTGGRGLRSFRERAVELGGSVELRSSPGAGATIVIVFPTNPDA
jgi:signal transduction histidine kinase